MPEGTVSERNRFIETYNRYRRRMVDAIMRDVAELPDRTSPPDQPDMMMVTAEELRTILMNHL